MIVDIGAIRTKLKVLNSTHQVDEEDEESAFVTLFKIYRDLDEELARLTFGNETDAVMADSILSAQTTIMKTAAQRRAKNSRDLLFKTAFWRWDAPYLDGDPYERTRYDAVMLSAFRDLARIHDEDLVRKPSDFNR